MVLKVMFIIKILAIPLLKCNVYNYNYSVNQIQFYFTFILVLSQLCGPLKRDVEYDNIRVK